MLFAHVMAIVAITVTNASSRKSHIANPKRDTDTAVAVFVAVQ